jgi:EmrB/QacA subfamily drug resistance transporter
MSVTALDGTTRSGFDRRWWTLLVLCLSLVIITLDNTILNVAIPTLVRDLHASDTQLQWIVDSYVLVFAGLLLTAGSLSDRLGRRGALTAGLLVFALGSVASALVESPGGLIVTRGVMGLGAAFVFPSTLSILTNVFTDPTERAKAIAIWAGMAGVGIALGPITGGWLLQRFYWGSIFLVNIPIVVLALVGGRLFVPTSRDPNAGRADPVGALLSLVGLVALVFAIIQGPDRGWTSAEIVGAFTLAAVALCAFVVVERRREQPMLDLAIFRNPRFTAASFAVTVVYFCLFGTIFVLTQHLQFLLGYSPFAAGIRVLPFALVLMPVANLTPRLVRRLGAKAVIALGLLVVAASLVLRATATVHTGYTFLLWCSVLFAAGMGLTIAPATASIMGAVPKEKAGVGSAVNDTTRQVGGALGVALLGSLFAAGYHAHLSARAPRGLPAGALAASRSSIGAALQTGHAVGGRAGAQLIDAARHAFIHGANVTSALAAVVAFVGAAVVVWALPSRAPVVVLEEPESVVDAIPFDAEPAVDLVEADEEAV